ncbi:MAG: thiamine phosphate synthase [Nitrospina sp.]|nr:thiamine phosphate synthase [Nitrospina sp.]MBT5258741.1 thiamine phosphate synthase [Nitrospina sp.]MBT6663175.1 thiamine phosphate synthase [Nitrospina sp.]MBT7522443.1 thiamine phosphate synthase [Nitrospina sp.]
MTTLKGLNWLRLYLITNRSLFESDNNFLEASEAALMGGVRALQLREKNLTDCELIELGNQLRILTSNYNAKLIMNSRADIAKIIDADGVHLTENSAHANEIKSTFPDLIVGVSTHSLEAAQIAEAQGADYITFSPIYATPSKANYGPPQGLGLLRQVSQEVNLPVLALGGITLHRVSECLEQGAFGVALISDIWNSSHIKEHSFKYTQKFGGNTL